MAQLAKPKPPPAKQIERHRGLTVQAQGLVSDLVQCLKASRKLRIATSPSGRSTDSSLPSLEFRGVTEIDTEQNRLCDYADHLDRIIQLF